MIEDRGLDDRLKTITTDRAIPGSQTEFQIGAGFRPRQNGDKGVDEIMMPATGTVAQPEDQRQGVDDRAGVLRSDPIQDGRVDPVPYHDNPVVQPDDKEGELGAVGASGQRPHGLFTKMAVWMEAGYAQEDGLFGFR